VSFSGGLSHDAAANRAGVLGASAHPAGICDAKSEKDDLVTGRLKPIEEIEAL
jgi:hypothetical protein